MMNIVSYNVTDVSYHYIGLRVLAGMPATAERKDQLEAISRSVLKFVTGRALRLMLPEPRGTFEAVGDKICDELAHFRFIRAERGRPYMLTDAGKVILALLDSKQYRELRQAMARVHLQTYDNLRAIVHTHIADGPVLRPIVATSDLGKPNYLQDMLEPAFGPTAPAVAESLVDDLPQNPKEIEGLLRARILQHRVEGRNTRITLFQSICDRLSSLRLLNKSRGVIGQYYFDKTYSPCVISAPAHPWYVPLQVALPYGATYEIYLCEPDMANPDYQDILLSAVDQAFDNLPMVGGYYDLPDLRDAVCAALSIPEAAFDEGINWLLDRQPSPLSVGLQYDGITGYRRPLLRSRQNAQIHNLIRRL